MTRAGENTLPVADLKGILAEVWLFANTINARLTEKGATTKEGLRSWIDKPGDPTYEAFWDLSPARSS